MTLITTQRWVENIPLAALCHLRRDSPGWLPCTEFLSTDGEHEHDSTVTSVSFQTSGELDHSLFEDWIMELLRTKGADLYRMKGVLSIKHGAMAASGDRWRSVAIGGVRWRSVAISGDRWRSVAISGDQWRSMTISGDQWRSVAIRGDQGRSVVMMRVMPHSSHSRAALRLPCGAYDLQWRLHRGMGHTVRGQSQQARVYRQEPRRGDPEGGL